MEAAHYLAQLRTLRPPGRALCAESGDPFGDILGIGANELARVDARVARLLEEADPRTTVEMLADWERAWGLPDECAPVDQTVAGRRAALLARITERRSPTRANFIALAATFGVDATIVEHHAHSTEDTSEDAVTDEEWAFVWDMISPELLLIEATTEDTTEIPLEVWPVGPHECAVRRMAPAHTLVRFGTYRVSFDFMAGTMPAGATLRRPSPATHIGAAGQLVEDVAHDARWDHDANTLALRGLLVESGERNFVNGPRFAGAVAGTPGTQPAGYSTFGGTALGITREILGVGTEDGWPYVDLHFYGTATSTTDRLIRPVGPTAVSAQQAQRWTFGSNMRLLGGSGTWSVRHVILELNSVGGQLDAGSTFFTPASSGRLAALRYGHSRTFLNPATAYVLGDLAFRFTAGLAGDVSVRLAGLRLGRGEGLSSLILPPVGTVAASDRDEDELTLDVPDGTYEIQALGGTVNLAGTLYTGLGIAAYGQGLRFAWPAAAGAAGERHLQHLNLRKVA